MIVQEDPRMTELETMIFFSHYIKIYGKGVDQIIEKH